MPSEQIQERLDVSTGSSTLSLPPASSTALKTAAGPVGSQMQVWTGAQQV